MCLRKVLLKSKDAISFLVHNLEKRSTKWCRGIEVRAWWTHLPHNLGAGVLLISPKGQQFHYTLTFGFKASKNKAKYQVLPVRLWLTKEIRAKWFNFFSDSQLVLFQIIGDFQVRGGGILFREGKDHPWVLWALQNLARP